jgi:hypothetical protein
MRKIVVVFWCWIVSASPGAALDLDSLLINSIGGPQALETLKRIESIHSVGKMSLNGIPGRFESFFVSPRSYYFEADFARFRLVQAYDGETAWQADLSGNVSEIAGYEKQELLSQVFFESYSHLIEGRLPGSAEYRGEHVRGDTTYHEVAFYPLGRDTVLVYYDKTEGLARFMVSNMDNLEAVTTMDDHREVSGLIIPHHTRATAAGAPVDIEMTIESVIIDGPVDSSMFAFVSSREKDYRFPPAADSVVIRFSYRNGHIYLPATVNGREKAWFILDSGASSNVLDRALVDKLDLSSVGTMAAKGIGGYEQVDLVQVDSVEVGELMMLDQISGALDLSAIGRASPFKREFGGVIGYDFLSRFPVLIDYRDSLLVAYRPEAFSPPEGGTEVPFFATMNIPTVEAELNGIKGDYLVDLGNAFGLMIHEEFAKAEDLEKVLDDIRDIDGEYGGVGGGIRGRTAYAASFALGDIRIQSLRVYLPEASGGLSGSGEIAGNIGNLVLENFRVLFDYADSRLIFYSPDE